MEWFSTWWNNLSGFAQVLYCVSIPSTLILIIQAVLIILGFSNSGPDMNISDTSGFDVPDCDCGMCDPTDLADASSVDGGHLANSADTGAMHIFTFQGIITFLCVFSWVGIAAYALTNNIPIAVIIGFIFGAAAMFGVAKLIQAMSKLSQSGNIVTKNFLGETGTVYLVIPATGKGHGKVNIAVGERYTEFDAITEDSEAIPDGTTVRVVDIRAENVLVVEKV